ncbi:2OG-Fe(II) oxygenase [Chitinimonas sp. BJB300]|uniref:2OG-Fe(II) oxygenase n=1 Tax=Chitinimonas sp. BJB300 TaxID=1559339 RepID=UPI000C0FE72C|nr:2OG-Fe(II) oxygenase [Chitinimonas sp. BJB300]PHV11665.1 2-oxoglutarate-dependent dioxygenase [Chitinimonas sp. BJB300]TSJ85918.1 2-oxoglutarate-dependent dioxygenase [Chitinimonas sp. BJB300]
MPELSREWQIWLKDNLQRGCSVASMVEAMVSAGFDAQQASAAVAAVSVGKDIPLKESIRPPVGEYIYDDWPIALLGNRIDGGDGWATVVMRCEKPQALVLDGVLSDNECDEVIARAKTKLRRSTTVDPLSGEESVIAQRSSEGTFFALREDDLIARLDARIARLMCCPVENGEGLQILRYGVGGEYRPHFDYFPPADPGSAKHIAQGGQRVATLVIYLSDVDQGGATIFPDVGLTVNPRKGSAVYFRYTNSQGQIDPLSLHGGAPVEGGEKWIMTKWVRQRRYS